MPIKYFEAKNKSPGKYLKNLREEKGISLEEVSRETKIKIRFLKTIEKDSLYDLIDITYAKINLINYARFLKADVKKVLELFEISSQTETDKRIFRKKKKSKDDKKKY